ncbi:MAG: Dabb family protein [Deltaproteobacteria bacterium]|nr:Dabb family protein [Deltaproteobacteria bacterium]
MCPIRIAGRGALSNSARDGLRPEGRIVSLDAMLTHVVLFWTKPEIADATERLVAGMHKYLGPIPGVRGFHIGKMVASPRPVVDSTYQVGLMIQVDDKAAEAAYQEHPLHKQFLEEVFKPCCDRVRVYDFAD